MALHMAGTPVCAMASIHCAAATENFLVLENHSVDDPEWNELVTGLPNPIIQDGFMEVPETPGLGIELNPDAHKEESPPERSRVLCTDNRVGIKERSHDRLWS